MKFKIGEEVREGGELGPISKIVDYKNGIYTVKSGNATGYMPDEYLHKIKRIKYEQLTLF